MRDLSDNADSLLTQLLKCEQIFVSLGLVLLPLIAWANLFQMSADMPASFASLAAMWGVMMIAMMVPSAAPMILVFAAVNRRRGRGVSTWIFLSGYVLIWSSFSVLAAALQATLHNLALLSSDMSIISPLVSGVLISAAGVYQLSSLKKSCLGKCAGPLDFVMTNWREGRVGALVMGIHHGLYCLGCCWVLMGLLFVTGIMNMIWVAVIASFIFAEKIFLPGRMSSAAGLILVALGVLTAAGVI